MTEINVNGKAHKVHVDPGTPLLCVIRDQLGVTGQVRLRHSAMRLLPVRSDHGHGEKNGSVERRFQDCNESVGAGRSRVAARLTSRWNGFAWRSCGLAFETPSVRQ